MLACWLRPDTNATDHRIAVRIVGATYLPTLTVSYQAFGLIKELGTFLAAQSTRFVLGTNCFLNALPSEPDTAASLTEYGGGAPDYTFANDLPAWENARVALTTRSTSSAGARANINAGWTALQRVANESLSGTPWLRVSAVQDPFLLRRDEQGRVVFQVNFDCQRRTTST